MVKEFFLFVCIVFASSFELKDFELDYNVDSSNISYGELFLGHSGGMPQPNDSPGGGDHSKFSVPPTSSSKPPTTTLRPTPTSTTTTTLGRPSSRSVPQPSIATSAENSLLYDFTHFRELKLPKMCKISVFLLIFVVFRAFFPVFL